jgi:hypothetical protein
MSVTLGSTLIAALFFSAAANAQEELRAYRQVAYESGHGTLTVKKGPGDAFYALNRADRCVWLFSSSGSTTGRISSIGMGPSDLLLPKDLAVDHDGNAIVADASGAVRVFSPTGQLLISFPFERPEHVASMSDGRILVSGFPKDYLISIFDRQGTLIGKLGTPAKVDDNSFFNAVLNIGTISVDGSDNIYYAFKYMLIPTVRKYKPDGTLVAEWHLSEGDTLGQVLAAAKKKYQENKKSANYGGVPILTAVTFDQDSGTLWVASGAQVTQLDSSGHTLRVVKLVQPDGMPLQTAGILVDRDTIRASTYRVGIFEYQKPH